MTEAIEINMTVRIDPEGARQLARLLLGELPAHLANTAPTATATSKGMPGADRLLDVSEVAAALGISKSSVYSMRYVGEAPPAIKLGNRLRWRRSDVEAWLAAQVSDQPAPGR